MSIEHKNAELIEKSLIELDKLRSETSKLLDIRSKFDELLESNNKLPVVFDERFSKIKSLVESFTLTLGKATKAYIDGNNELFVNNLEKLRIERNNLQNQINYLESQVHRLEKIDLEKHFDKLQKTLSDIFGAINAINLTLTSITQNLNIIVQSLDSIKTSIKLGFGETDSLISSGFHKTNENINKSTEKIISDLASHINFKANEIDQHLVSRDSKIQSLIDQNDFLKKMIKTNRIIQILGIVILLGILVYGLVK